MTQPPLPLSIPGENRVTTLDDTARLWFADLHTLQPGMQEYEQITSSVAFALGYDFENMTQVDIEDFYTRMGALTLYSAMHAPEATDFIPDDITAEFLTRQARDVVRDVMALAYLDNDHFGDIEQGYRDTMTDAYNERGLNRYLRRKFGLDRAHPERRVEHNGEPPEVCIGDDDLTNFKRFNTVLGDEVGDAAIREAFDELEENFRLSDDTVIARYRRGDEFEIILSGVDSSELAIIEDRLIDLQLDKVRDDRYIRAWEQIYNVRDELIASGLHTEGTPLPGRVEVELVDEGAGERPVRILYIGDMRMMPLRNLVIHSIGFARGVLATWENHVNLHEQAKAANKARKTMLQRMMGGADRTE